MPISMSYHRLHKNGEKEDALQAETWPTSGKQDNSNHYVGTVKPTSLAPLY